MKIAVFDAETWGHQACLTLKPPHEVICTREPLSPTVAARYAEANVLSPFVNSDLSGSVLRLFPKLKADRNSTGYDHIDLDYSARTA